jgi:hypothetical protein
VDLERVRYRLGHGDLTATTRHVKILDEQDPTAADAIATIPGDVARRTAGGTMGGLGRGPATLA